jgi:Trypsin
VRFFDFMKSSVQAKSPAVALTLAGAGMVLLGGALVFAQTSPPRATKRIVSVIFSPSEQRAVQWTEGRMRNAKPLPIPVAKATPGGAPKSAPSGPRSAAVRGEAGPAQNVGQADRKTGDPNSIPLRWAGKLFFKTSKGDYVCSAQFIAPHIVLTAAHCVQDSDTGEKYHDFYFGLQYQRGKATQIITPKCLGTWDTWVRSSPDDENFWHFDYAMILSEESSKTGYFGSVYNYQSSDYSNAVKVGYPGDILEGEVVQMDGGPLTFPETRPGLVRLQHGNPKNAGGSSGGAWVGNLSPAIGRGTNMVISVTSHHVGDDTTVSYGPQFDGDWKKLYDFVQRGCK